MKVSGVIQLAKPKQRIPIYDYPEYDFEVTKEYTNIGMELSFGLDLNTSMNPNFKVRVYNNSLLIFNLF